LKTTIKFAMILCTITVKELNVNLFTGQTCVLDTGRKVLVNMAAIVVRNTMCQE
jgi:hypothetical protein